MTLLIIMAMKRIFIAFMLLSTSLLSGAEMASWYIVTEPGYTTDNGTEFSSASSEAASSRYPAGSVLELVSEDTGRSSVVTITDSLPELPEGRTLAVTEKAMEELGLMDSGTGMVEERVLRLGQDDDSKEIVTGWYKYDLGLYADTGECFRIYSLLRENGLKPSIQIDGDAIHLSVEYVMAFERENTEAIIRSLGLEPGEAMIAQNPYT